MAYSVCVDNDGDGFCIQDASTVRPGCEDQIFFSHSDGGAFYNPLGPLPTPFKAGCSGGFPGWVVFLCSGAHSDGTVHTHQPTSGTITPNWAGTGYGDFCGNGGSRERTDLKSYVIATSVSSSFTEEELVIHRNPTLPPTVTTPPGFACGTFADPLQVVVHCTGPSSSRSIATRVDAASFNSLVTGRSGAPTPSPNARQLQRTLRGQRARYGPATFRCSGFSPDPTVS